MIMSILSFLAWPVPYILMIVIVTAFHELGHFAAMRLFGCKVSAFAIGLFKPLLKVRMKRSGTEFRVSPFLIGGFVLATQKSDPLASEIRGSFYDDLPVWKRFSVVAAGPIASFALAFLLFAGGIWMDGLRTSPATVVQVVSGGPADRAGLVKGDTILTLGRNQIDEFRDIGETIVTGGGYPMVMKVRHADGVVDNRILVPWYRPNALLGNLVTPMMGASFGPETIKRYGPISSFGKAVSITYEVGSFNAAVLREIVVGRLSVKFVQGPVGSAKTLHQVASSGRYMMFFWIIGGFSLSLGIFNLLPILPMDGGRMFFLILEWSARKPVSMETQDKVTRFGLGVMCLVFVISVFVDLGGMSVMSN